MTHKSLRMVHPSVTPLVDILLCVEDLSIFLERWEISLVIERNLQGGFVLPEAQAMALGKSLSMKRLSLFKITNSGGFSKKGLTYYLGDYVAVLLSPPDLASL